VRIHWTIIPRSKFAAETDEHLTRLGIRLTPWKQAYASTYELIPATSGNGDLHRLDGPLMLLPHGTGYSRVLAPGHTTPAGLALSQLLRSGRVIPRLIGLEHEDRRARLAAYCPEAVPHRVVLGDPSMGSSATYGPLRASPHGPGSPDSKICQSAPRRPTDGCAATGLLQALDAP
jgi:hypothetical protein